MRRHKGDVTIAIFTALLMMIGLIVIYAIGPLRANFMNSIYGTTTSPDSFFHKQLFVVVVSIIAFILAYNSSFDLIKKLSRPTLLTGLGSCILLMLLALAKSKLARCELGACRWFNFGSIGFQPAELLKIGIIFYFADLISARKKSGKFENSSDFWLPFSAISAASLFFTIVVQKDLGTGASIMAIILAMLLASGISLKKFSLILLAIAVSGVLFILTSSHRMERLTTFKGGSGANTYHIDNAMLAIGTGGLFGVGVGNSIQATGYLPESINDSIFAVMGETFGFFGLAVVMGLFYFLLRSLLVSANKMMDEQKRLILVGVFAWLGAHVAINIMAMTGLIPLTGITLPLLSFGGTSMLFVGGMVGLCFMLSRYTEREEIADLVSKKSPLDTRQLSRRIRL